MDLVDVLVPLNCLARIVGACSCRFGQVEDIKYVYYSKPLFLYSLVVNAAFIFFQGGVLLFFFRGMANGTLYIASHSFTSAFYFVLGLVCIVYIILGIACAYTVFLRSRHISTVFNRLNLFQMKILHVGERRLRTLFAILCGAVISNTGGVIIIFLSCMYLTHFNPSVVYLVHLSVLCADVLIAEIHGMFFMFFVYVIGLMYLELGDIIQKNIQFLDHSMCLPKQPDIDMQLIGKMRIADELIKDTAGYINDTHGIVNLATVMLISCELLYGVSQYMVFENTNYSAMWIVQWAFFLFQFTLCCKFATTQVSFTP